MSNKVYVIFNTDIGQAMAVVKDKQLAKEYLCDFFLEDVLYQWFWCQEYDKDFNPKEEAQDVWYEIFDWYNSYVEIFESEIIE